MIANETYGECVTTALNHYLFCNPWTTAINSCTNPINPIETSVEMIRAFIEIRFPQYDYLIPTLNESLNSLTEFDSCNDTYQVYGESKQNICFQVNNSLMQITLLYIIQSPILVVLLIYVLFGWYRFHFEKVPYNKSTPRIDPSGILSDRNEELGPLAFSDDPDTRLLDDDNSLQSTESNNQDNGNIVPLDTSINKYSPIQHYTNQDSDLKSILRKNKATVIFTGALFLVVFLSIIIWFGILNHAFNATSQIC